ncbi:MAG: hypothetical protein Q9170_008359, partial [Blastenia crenularia]
MKSILSLSSLFALLLASLVIAAPFDAASNLNQLVPRARTVAQCQSESDPSCWDTLRIKDYLTNWNKTTPACEVSRGDGSDCCTAEESWTTCYLRLAHKAAGYECDSTNSNFCSGSVLRVSNTLPPAIQAQAMYVVQAIYQIHQLFAAYNSVLNTDNSPILANILEGFQQYDLSLSVLAYGLPVPHFLGLSIAQVTAWNSTSLQPIAQIWSDALTSTPSVQQILWPITAGSNSQSIPLNTVGQLLLAASGDPLGNALKLVLSDMNTFLNFTSNGRFVGASIPSLQSRLADSKFEIATGLYTFVTSKLMQKNDYYAVPGEVVDRAAFESTN